MITFIEDRCTNYQHRTFLNVDRAEFTLIFAADLTTAGEKCTLNACRNCERPVASFLIGTDGRISSDQEDKLKTCIEYMKENNVTSINIAGNGIYTFAKFGVTQERLNNLVANFIRHLISTGCNITSLRSGGQTGADEAGLVAGDRLGLITICLCPKGWRFRDINNQDVKSEELFKGRFQQ
jgi:hypothetical protein